MAKITKTLIALSLVAFVAACGQQQEEEIIIVEEEPTFEKF